MFHINYEIIKILSTRFYIFFFKILTTALINLAKMAGSALTVWMDMFAVVFLATKEVTAQLVRLRIIFSKGEVTVPWVGKLALMHSYLIKIVS